MGSYLIYNEDCIVGAPNHIGDRSVDLLICDPPFGIHESGFNKHYARSGHGVILGYAESPEDYYGFTLDWMKQAFRVLKDEGTIYVVSGWNKLEHVLRAASMTEFDTINHVIWRYNFGVYTTRKFVTSHYHILYMKKKSARGVAFNTHCRFGSDEKDDGSSLLYRDLEDVWSINKEYRPGDTKNPNKLPNALVEKMVLYSSSEGDIVGDFFLGNFTTAIVSKSLGRVPIGFEVNPNAFSRGFEALDSVVVGSRSAELKVVSPGVPLRRGARMDADERQEIAALVSSLIDSGSTKQDAVRIVAARQGRGTFSIINVLKGWKAGVDS